MPKPKQTANFSDIHRGQLFHWVGANIDADLRARKLTALDVREKYLTYLKDDLQNGLPIKSPKVPEKPACDGVEIPLNLPMACFTEWSLSESRPHISRYGRMALGFSKPWIIKHGGQPVTYFNHTQKGLFLKTLVALHDFVRRLKEPTPVPGVKATEIEAAFKRALYLLHFAKPFAAPLQERVPKPKLIRPPIHKRPATRYFGPVLEFLEEREWRIVRHDKPYFAKDPVGLFDSRLSFEPGSELFTLMLPDNELVKMVWRDKFLRNRLLKAPVPVSVLSFQDICGEKIALPRADQPIQLTRRQAEEVEANRRAPDQRSRFEQVLFRLKTYVTEQKIDAPECFVSYAWGNPDHERWVEKSLATDLQKAGIAVVLDRWENARIGASVPRFVERVAKSDRIIVVGTPLYRKKYDNNEPMRGFVAAAEGDLIGKRMIGTEAQKESVLPILLEGVEESGFPYLLHGRVYADFRKSEAYFDTALDLLLSLYQIKPQDAVAIELRKSLGGRKT